MNAQNKIDTDSFFLNIYSIYIYFMRYLSIINNIKNFYY
jgi:hypothetical protein